METDRRFGGYDLVMIVLDPNETSLAILKRYNRFNIVGTSGSGKSTFGRNLAKRLELPYIEMDRLFWKPNWTESSDDEFFAKLRTTTREEGWILDGNYSRTTSIKWSRTEVVIWIDMPFATTTYQVTKRALQRSLSRAELWPGTGNRESLKKAFFSRDSIIWWSVSHYFPVKRKYEAVMNSTEYPNLAFLRLSSPKQIARLVGG